MIKQLSPQNIQWYRKIVQYLFLATVFLIGIKFSILPPQPRWGAVLQQSGMAADDEANKTSRRKEKSLAIQARNPSILI